MQHSNKNSSLHCSWLESIRWPIQLFVIRNYYTDWWREQRGFWNACNVLSYSRYWLYRCVQFIKIHRDIHLQICIFSKCFIFQYKVLKKIKNWLTTASFWDVYGSWLGNTYSWKNECWCWTLPLTELGRRTTGTEWGLKKNWNCQVCQFFSVELLRRCLFV